MPEPLTNQQIDELLDQQQVSPTLSGQRIDELLNEQEQKMAPPSGQAVRQFNPSSSQFIQAPQGASPTMLNIHQQLANGESAASMFGETVIDDDRYSLLGYDLTGDLSDPDNTVGQFKRWIATASDMTLGFAGSAIRQTGEYAEERDPFAELNEPFDFKRGFTEVTPIGMLGKWVSRFDAITGLDTSQEWIRAGAFLQGANDMFIAEYELREADPTWVGLLGEGAISLAGAAGLTMVTKNPATASTYFMSLQQTDAYKAAIESGMDIRDASFYSSVEAVAIGALEYIGIDALFKVSGNVLMRAAKGMATEAVQEGSQELAEISGRMFADIEEISGEEAFERVAVSGIIGGVLGGSAGPLLGSVSSRDTDGAKPVGSIGNPVVVSEQEFPRDRDKVYVINANGEVVLSTGALEREIAKEVMAEAEIDRDASSETPLLLTADDINKKRGVVKQIINDFMNGVEVDPVIHSTKKLREKVQKVIDGMNTRRMEAGAAVREGRLRVLQQQLSEEQAKLSEIEQKGEEFVIKFRESFKDKGLSEETQSLVDAVSEILSDIDESTQRAIESGQDPFDVIFDRRRKEIQDAMELVEEAEYEVFIDEMREDQDFVWSLEENIRFKRIEKQAARKVADVEALIDEMDTVQSMGDETAITELARKKIQVRAGIIKKLEEAGYADFFKGMKLSRQMTEAEATAINKELNKIVDGIMKEARASRFGPKKKVGKKGKFRSMKFGKEELDALEVKLRRAIKNPAMTQEAFLEQVGKLQQAHSVAVEQMYRDRFVKRVEAIVKSYPIKEAGAHINDALEVMSAIRKGKVDPSELIISLSRDMISNNADMMAFMYAKLVRADSARPKDMSLGDGDIDGTAFDWGVFLVNLEDFVDSGKAWGEIKSKNKKKLAQRDKEEILKRLVPKTEGPVREKIKEKLPPDIDRTLAEITREARDNVGGLWGTYAYHYNTLLEIFNLQDTVLSKHIDADMAYRRKYNQWMNKFSKTVMDSAAYKDLRSKPKLSVRTSRGQKKYSMGQLLTIYMYAQNDGTKKRLIEKNGIKQVELDKIEAYIGKDGVALANSIMSLYDEMYDSDINPEYRKKYGHNLRKRNNYSPIRTVTGGKDDMDLTNEFTIMGLAESTFFKEVKGNNMLDVEQDAFSNFTLYVRGTQHWIAYHDFFSKANEVLSDEQVKLDFIDKHGKSNYNNLMMYIERLQKERTAQTAFNNGVAKFVLNNIVTSRIGASLQIMEKQMITSALAMGEVSSLDYLKYMGEFMSNPAEIFRELAEHDTLKYRGNTLDPEMATAFDSLPAMNGKISELNLLVQNIRKWSGLNVTVGDQFAVASGAYVIMRSLESKGSPRDVALDYAMAWAERTQQSSLPSNRTLASLEKGDLTKLLTMFSTSPVALANYERRAWAEWSNGKISLQTAIRKTLVVHSVSALFGYIAGGFGDLEDYFKGDFWFYMIAGPLGSIPALGPGLAKLVAAATGGDPYSDEALAEDVLVSTFNDIASSVTSGDYIEAIAFFGGSVTGIPLENIQDTAEGAITLDPLKLQGFSDYVSEQGRKDEETKPFVGAI